MNRPDRREYVVQRSFNDRAHRRQRELNAFLLLQYPLQLGNVGSRLVLPVPIGITVTSAIAISVPLTLLYLFLYYFINSPPANTNKKGLNNIRAKNVVIPPLSPIEREIKAIYVAIFSDRNKIPAICTVHREIRTKNTANGDEHAQPRIIST